jgi:hypothetical protein
MSCAYDATLVRMGGPPGQHKETMLGWRRWAAAGLLLLYAAVVSWQSVPSVDFPFLVVVAAVALGLLRRAVLAQVLAQGVTWFWFVQHTVDVARQIIGL